MFPIDPFNITGSCNNSDDGAFPLSGGWAIARHKSDRWERYTTYAWDTPRNKFYKVIINFFYFRKYFRSHSIIEDSLYLLHGFSFCLSTIMIIKKFFNVIFLKALLSQGTVYIWARCWTWITYSGKWRMLDIARVYHDQWFYICRSIYLIALEC